MSRELVVNYATGRPEEWKANVVDAYDVTDGTTVERRGGEGERHALRRPPGARKRETSAMFARRRAHGDARVNSRFPGRALTITVARRESGVPLAESFVLRRTFGHFVSERVPHAFRWCSRKIRVEVTVVGRHWECGDSGARRRRRYGDDADNTNNNNCDLTPSDRAIALAPTNRWPRTPRRPIAGKRAARSAATCSVPFARAYSKIRVSPIMMLSQFFNSIRFTNSPTANSTYFPL